MAIIPGAVIAEVQRKMQDSDAEVWTESDVIEYINNALFEILKLRPNAFSVTEGDQMVAGTKQSLPNSTDYMLLDVLRNLGVTGTDEGRVITSMERWQLDMLNQHWHKGTGKSFTEHYNYEPQKSLSTYYIFPPAKSGSEHFIEVNVARPHTKIVRIDAGDVTPNFGTNVFKKISHGFALNDRVTFTTTVTLPSGIVAIIDYFVVDKVTLGVFTTDFVTDDKLLLIAHGLVDDDRVQLTTDGTLPGGLAISTRYFVINSTPNDFELSSTSGGSAINITDDGTGVHSVETDATDHFGVSLKSSGTIVDYTDDGTGVTTVNTTNKFTALTIDASHEAALKEWMYYECYSKETSVASAKRAEAHRSAFFQMYGMKEAQQRVSTEERKGNK